MNYYSLNNNTALTSFETAVIKGLAPDRGLYFPETITALDPAFFESIESLTNQEIAYEAIKQFINPEIPETVLKKIIADTLQWLPSIEMKVRIYRDARMAEVIEWCSDSCIPWALVERKGPQSRDEKWQWNVFLGELLYQALRHKRIAKAKSS